MLPKRLKELRLEHKLKNKDVAKALNVSESTYGKWELGKRKPGFATVKRIAEFFQVSTDFLLGHSEFRSENERLLRATTQLVPSQLHPIPVFCSEEAAHPAPQFPLHFEYTAVAEPEDHFFLKVADDSMAEIGIPAESLVLIHRQNTAENGQLVACVLEGRACLRRYSKRGETILLLEENKRHMPEIFSAEDFALEKVRLLGVARKLIRNL